MRCPAWWKAGLAGVLFVASACPVCASSPTEPRVAIFADPGGTQCNLVDDAVGVKEYYVILDAPNGLRGVDFSAPKPDCFDAVWLGDQSAFLTLGNSHVGISIAFPGCWPTPVNVLTIFYYTTASTPDCCYYPVLPRPDLAAVQMTDCDYHIVAGVGLANPINSDGVCECGTGTVLDSSTNPNPPDYAYGLPVVTTLSWSPPSTTHPPLRYNVYFGTEQDPPLVVSDTPDSTFDPGILDFSTTYYWRIEAHDAGNGTSSGELWRFSTKLFSTEWLMATSLNDHCPADSDTVVVDVRVENALIDMDDGAFYLSYDSNLMPYAGCERGELTTAWTQFECEDLGTHVRVTASGTTPIPAGASGVFARLKFLSACCNAEDPTQVDLCPGNVSGDLRTLSVVCGEYDCGGFPELGPSTNPLPPHNAYQVPVVTTLRWSPPFTAHPPLRYDVYFGTAQDPPLVAVDHPDTVFNPGILNFSTTYYWKIVGHDTAYGKSRGPVWKFSTKTASAERLIVSSWSDHCPTTGDTVVVDVSIENALVDVDDGGLYVSYDPALTPYLGGERGGLTASWAQFECANAGARVRVTASDTIPIPAGASGSFARLKFLSTCCSAEAPTGVAMCAQNVTGDLRALFPVCGSYTCGPDTILVMPDGSGEAPTIQDAVDTYDGAVILLADGVYTGPGNRDVDFAGERIVIRSQSGNPASCVIDCQGSAEEPHRGFVFRSAAGASTVLEGVTIANAYANDSGAAVRVDGAAPTLRNLVVVDATVAGDSSAGGAVYVRPDLDAGVTTIRDCTIIRPNTSGIRVDADPAGGSATGAVIERVTVQFASGHAVELAQPATISQLFAFCANGAGIRATAAGAINVSISRFGGNRGGAVHATGPLTLLQCSVVANRCEGATSVLSSAGANIGLSRCLVAFNGPLFGNVGTVQASCCDVFGNTGGDWVGPIAGQLGANGNISKEPLIANLEYQVLSNSPCRPSGNPCGMTIGLSGVGAGRVYTVGSNEDGSGDFPSIQKALDAFPGSTKTASKTIHLLSGTYTGPDNTDLDFLGKSVTVQAATGQASDAIVDCEYTARGVHFRGDEDSTSVLRHVTIRNGVGDKGGGILCDGLSPKVEHCIVRSCSATVGGGIYLANNKVRLIDVAFVDCAAADSAGGLFASSASQSGVVSDCTLTGCRAVGAGGAIYARNTAVSACTVTQSSATLGGGIYTASGNVVSCDVDSNTASGRGGGVYVVLGDVTNCTIINNVAGTDGGGVFAAGACSLERNEILDNVAGAAGGGVYGADLVMTRTLIARNSADVGGGVGGAGIIERCTIAHNTAATQGGGVCLVGDSELRKSIVAFSASGEGIYCAAGAASLTCTDVFGNDGGDFVGCIAGQDTLDSNFALDPLFVDPDANDYSLEMDSPCLTRSDVCGVEIGSGATIVSVVLGVNANTMGASITVQVEPEPPARAQDIVVSGVRLNGLVPLPGSGVTCDCDNDGVVESYFYFDRVSMQQTIPQGNATPLVATGVIGAKPFYGSTTIAYYFPRVTRPRPYADLTWGDVITVAWEPPATPADAVDVLLLFDQIYFWPVGSGPNNGAMTWQVPVIGYFFDCRIVIALKRQGVTVGVGMSEAPFSIGGGWIATALRSSSAVVERGDAVIRWETSEESDMSGFRVMRSEQEDDGYRTVGPDVIAARGAGVSYEFRDDAIVPNVRYYYRLFEVTDDGSQNLLWSESVEFRLAFALEQNFPNPFNPTTTIAFSVPEQSHVDLAVYDVAGRVVRTLVDEERPADYYRIVWDGRDNAGVHVSSGVYFYRLVAGNRTQTRKMVMLR